MELFDVVCAKLIWPWYLLYCSAVFGLWEYQPFLNFCLEKKCFRDAVKVKYHLKSSGVI